MVIYVPAAWEEARRNGISAWKKKNIRLWSLQHAGCRGGRDRERGGEKEIWTPGFVVALVHRARFSQLSAPYPACLYFHIISFYYYPFHSTLTCLCVCVRWLCAHTQPTLPSNRWQCSQAVKLFNSRAGHFRYFSIFSIIKNDFFALFIKLITYFCTIHI